MTSTRFPLLAAAACLIALSGCDAVGPESVSASATTPPLITTGGSVEIAPVQAHIIAPPAIKSTATCRLNVISGSPVVSWRVSRHLEIVGTRANAIAIRATGPNGQRGRVMGVTEDGQHFETMLRIQEDAVDC